MPPGGDVPVEQMPWPDEERSVGRKIEGRRLPNVPTFVPAGLATPSDWRTLAGSDPLAPPGYRSGIGAAMHPYPRTDGWGIAACIVAAVGLIQVFVVRVPGLCAVAIALGLSGLRFRRMAETQSGRGWSRWTNQSLTGVVMGAVGVVLGVSIWWVTGRWSAVTL